MKLLNTLLILLATFAFYSCSNVDTDSNAAATAAPDISVEDMPQEIGPDENIVEVTETFYVLTLKKSDNTYHKTQTNEANPGDLIELNVNAKNLSDKVLRNIELTNSVPTESVDLVAGSIVLDKTKGLYRISRNGEAFFPSDAEINASDIQFIQWEIFSLAPNESLDLTYQLRVDRGY